MSVNLRVGIAGFGVVGRRRRLCVDDADDMTLVAVCDRDLESRSNLPPEIQCFDRYERLLEEPLDALFVCMSNDMAAEVTAAALHRGIHVFCEKPPARNLAEMHSVVQAELLNPNLKLMYGFNHRYHDSVEDALRIVRSGELGDVLSLRGVYGKSQLITFDQSDWRTQRSLAGGGVLLDQGIHMVDLMILFAGDFSEVHSIVSNAYWGFDVEDNVYALMRSDRGVVAQLTSSATQWRHAFNLEITLTKGSLILGGILSGSKSYGYETLTIVRSDPTKDRGEPREETVKYNEDPSWMREVISFRDCITSGARVTSGSSSEAMKTLELVYRIYYNDPTWRERFAIPSPSTSSESADGVFVRPEPVAET